MKTALKYLTLGIVITVMGFLSLGLIHPSFTYSNTIRVDSSIEEAFTVFTDVYRAGDWLIGYKEYDILEGERYKVGSNLSIKFKVEGNKMECVETLTAFKQNEELSFDMASEYVNHSVEVKFSGTFPCNIEITTVTSGKNVFYCSIFYLMKNVLKDQSQKNYDLLKTIIEQ